MSNGLKAGENPKKYECCKSIFKNVRRCDTVALLCNACFVCTNLYEEEVLSWEILAF